MDFHILTQEINQNTINVVFHISVFATNNDAGITWQQAIVKEAGGADNIMSVLSDIEPAELTAMKSGALIEKMENVRFSSIFLNNAQRLQEVKDRYNILKTLLTEEKQITLIFMGYGGNV